MGVLHQFLAWITTDATSFSSLRVWGVEASSGFSKRKKSSEAMDHEARVSLWDVETVQKDPWI